MRHDNTFVSSIFISVPTVHSEDLHGTIRHCDMPAQQYAVAPNPQATAQPSNVLAQVEPQRALWAFFQA
jgi:hypothetical protein